MQIGKVINTTLNKVQHFGHMGFNNPVGKHLSKHSKLYIAGSLVYIAFNRFIKWEASRMEQEYVADNRFGKDKDSNTYAVKVKNPLCELKAKELEKDDVEGMKAVKSFTLTTRYLETNIDEDDEEALHSDKELHAKKNLVSEQRFLDAAVKMWKADNNTGFSTTTEEKFQRSERQSQNAVLEVKDASGQVTTAAQNLVTFRAARDAFIKHTAKIADDVTIKINGEDLTYEGFCRLDKATHVKQKSTADSASWLRDTAENGEYGSHLLAKTLLFLGTADHNKTSNVLAGISATVLTGAIGAGVFV